MGELEAAVKEFEESRLFAPTIEYKFFKKLLKYNEYEIRKVLDNFALQESDGNEFTIKNVLFDSLKINIHKRSLEYIEILLENKVGCHLCLNDITIKINTEFLYINPLCKNLTIHFNGRFLHAECCDYNTINPESTFNNLQYLSCKSLADIAFIDGIREGIMHLNINQEDVDMSMVFGAIGAIKVITYQGNRYRGFIPDEFINFTYPGYERGIIIHKDFAYLVAHINSENCEDINFAFNLSNYLFWDIIDQRKAMIKSSSKYC